MHLQRQPNVFLLQQTVEAWRLVFYLGAAVYVFGAIFYALLGSGEIQPWAVPTKTDELQSLDDKDKETSAKEKKKEEMA